MNLSNGVRLLVNNSNTRDFIVSECELRINYIFMCISLFVFDEISIIKVDVMMFSIYGNKSCFVFLRGVFLFLFLHDIFKKNVCRD